MRVSKLGLGATMNAAENRASLTACRWPCPATLTGDVYDDDAIWSFFIAGIGNLETDDQDGIVFREWLSDHRNRALDVMKSLLREDD